MTYPDPCLRCGGPIPTAESPGAYPGAVSRATPERDIEICSPCGTDEGVRQHMTGRVIPPARWPLAHPHAFRDQAMPR